MELAVLPRLYRPLKSELAPDPLRERIAAAVELCAVKMLDPALIEAIAEDTGLIKKKLSQVERIARLAGRMFAALQRHHARKVAGVVGEVYSVEQGNDLGRLLPAGRGVC